MKQIELNLKKRLLIVEVDNCDITIDKDGIHFYFLRSSKKFIPGNFHQICKGSELTEEIAIELVPQKMNVFIPQFWNYKDREDLFYAKESVISAIQAQGYYWGENPLGKKPELTDNQYDKEREFIENNTGELVFGDHYADWSMWNEAESKTFNPEKTLIFEILL